jgi:hypothetical protein
LTCAFGKQYTKCYEGLGKIIGQFPENPIEIEMLGKKSIFDFKEFFRRSPKPDIVYDSRTIEEACKVHFFQNYTCNYLHDILLLLLLSI